MKESAEKSRFSVCRVCLAFDMRMHTMGPILLKIFEKITKTKMNLKDGKPNTVCYICFSLLKRCVLFANMSRIAEEILNQILLTNSKITKDLIIQHSTGILTTYYPIPAVTYSYAPDTHRSENVTTESIVKGHITRVPNETEKDDQGVITITENMKEEPLDINVKPETSNVMQNEQLIIVGNQTTKIEKDDLEQIITQIALKIESEPAELNEIVEPVTQEKDYSITEKIKSDKLENKENNNKEKFEKTDINELITELRQEIVNGIERGGMEDDRLKEIKQEIEADATDCIIILSDEDESNDKSIIIEDDEHKGLYEPSKKKSKSTYALPKHMEIHTDTVNAANTRRYQCEFCTKVLSHTALANHECFRVN